MTPPGRRRLSRPERLAQLLDTARLLVQAEGTDALTLGRLAGQAGVTKPVVYDHFATREGLLAALYADYDRHQTAVMAAALAAAEPGLAARATVIAEAYVGCVLTERQEIPGVAAALAGAPEMDALKRRYQADFIARCRAVLAPFAGDRPLAPAGLWAMLGAADALSEAATRGDIGREEAVAELRRVLMSLAEG
ncbi:TetR/AcrR family transcriptional regulator [Roseomonas sp. 18066]|uniref:TetR/AcrR family transcriptional regulator n=1 Tax=Roseomonas sp. 18066 TaxID=2681412 RepID=UPI00135C7551|nr:TetR/AcrR family transcriptional regulator [Roseomonas sp. 18066]